MIYKGRVIDMVEEYAIVLTDHVEYYKVIKKGDLFLGKQIIFLDDDIYKERTSSLMTYVRYAAIFILLVISTVIISQIYNMNESISMAMAVVSLDINPSVEFEIDKDSKLLNIIAKNKEGKLIVDQDMIGKDIKEVLYVAIENAKNKKYLTNQDDTVIIGVGILDESFNIHLEGFKKNLIELIRSDVDFKDIQLIILEGDKADIEASRENNITVGKYRLCKSLLLTHEDTSLEDIKSMKIDELVEYPMKQNINTNQFQWGNQYEEVEKDIRQPNTSNTPNTNGQINKNQSETKPLQNTPPTSPGPIETNQRQNNGDEIINENNANQENCEDGIIEEMEQPEGNTNGQKPDNESGNGNGDQKRKK